MAEDKTIVIGDYIDPEESERFDLSSTLRLRARSIDQKKLWASKDRSAEFMGDIWSLFVDSEKEKQIKTVLHSVCVELIENSVKYGCQDHDYIITTDLCLKNDELLVYVVNQSDPSMITGLENAANQILESDNIRKLFKQKMKEAKAAKKLGKSKSQLGYIRIVMQNVRLAWQIKMESDTAMITTLARISLTEKDA
ncbi:hypothetical protein QUF70_15830 [Desulfobacterales bacterium HSG17]|nr:hypothetical protein [Desulfobacterales bacterium HSG17]